ncbi:CynX/NimT family MFS transporter [Pseudonocardia petroleophila]|uniref:MFS transporter n=1 Tax=Pseudonocardia petroleophila TaxID=37331 RepID=A0A7G7MD45_9PSEU|nr:MFS transporter [Pseudonocardia petroleophila]
MEVVTSTRPATAVRPGTGTGLLVLALVVLALNLRGPIVAISPVLDTIRADLGIGAGTAGLLTSLPVLCFALATPLASLLLARAGLERGVLIALGALLVGTVVRSTDGLPAVIVGTLVIGIAITVGNVAVPVIVGRDVPAHRAGIVLGGYTAALNVGSMIMLSFTVPLAAGLGWRPALAAWGLVAVLAAGVFWLGTRGNARRAAEAPAPDEGVGGGPVWWRRPIVWALTIAFGGQAFSYYGVTAWLPLLLHDELGMDPAAAGVSASVFQVAAVAGAFGVPVLLRVFDRPLPSLLVVCAFWATLPLGLLLAPELWPVWCALGGVAQGGGFTVIFSIVVRAARGPAEGRRMSALVQGGGYLVAATGPTVVGAVHEATNAWTVPLLVVLGAVAVLTVAGSYAASARAA